MRKKMYLSCVYSDPTGLARSPVSMGKLDQSGPIRPARLRARIGGCERRGISLNDRMAIRVNEGAAGGVARVNRRYCVHCLGILFSYVLMQRFRVMKSFILRMSSHP